MVLFYIIQYGFEKTPERLMMNILNLINTANTGNERNKFDFDEKTIGQNIMLIKHRNIEN